VESFFGIAVKYNIQTWGISQSENTEAANRCEKQSDMFMRLGRTLDLTWEHKQPRTTPVACVGTQSEYEDLQRT